MKNSRNDFIKKVRDENPFLSNTEVVYLTIRNDIVNHAIKPGERLNQEQLAEELGVSRTPVRDALYMLEKEGYLDKNAQGYTVARMTISDYMRLVDLRAAIECLAVRLACFKIRMSESRRIKDNIAATQDLLEKGFGYAWDEDLSVIDEKRTQELMYRFAELDQEFHLLIIEASHNEYVSAAYAQMEPKIHFHRHTVLNVNHVMNMVARHKSIYEYIAKREEEEAESRMLRHLQLTVDSAK